MKIQSVYLTLALLSALFAEAFLSYPPNHQPNSALLSRKRKKKPPQKMPADGWAKYFHEPGGTELANHYDSRYEHGILSYEEKQDSQVHMMRAYLDFFKKNGIETWLAHGTLLGWWWNGKMLPWDWDIDTQVSGRTLMYLGEHFNGSIYDYNSADSDPDLKPIIERQYLLDVNPAIAERDRGNGDNVIDARWIDLRNGLYIDVTGLSETEPQDQPGVWSCKNYHRYRTTDLYPMRETMYEGVVAKVPYAYERILAEEYQEKALVVTDYEGHKWRPDIKEWVKKTPDEIKQERLNRQQARRKKQEEKAEKKKAKEEKEKAEQEAKAKANAVPDEGKKDEKEDDHSAEQGIKEPEKEPIKIKRNAELDPDPEPDPEPGSMKESSGLAHLRRRHVDQIA